MSGRTTPDCESLSESHDNDSQSECSEHSRSISLISDGTEADSDSSTVLARYGCESDRLSSPDVTNDLDFHPCLRRPGPEVGFLQAGAWAPQNPGTGLPRQEGVIPQELFVEDESNDMHIQRRFHEEGMFMENHSTALL